MAILQERCLRDRDEMTSWARAMAAETEAEVKRRSGNLYFRVVKQSLFFEKSKPKRFYLKTIFIFNHKALGDT